MKKSKSILGEHPSFADAQIHLLNLSARLRGYNFTVFFLQLEFALWLFTAKLIVTEQTARKPESDDKAAGTRPDPIAALFKLLARKNPTLPKLRRLNQWIQALLAALAAEGVLNLPQRAANGKQPKPKGLHQLGNVCRHHLKKIVDQYGCMSNLLDELCAQQNADAAVSENSETDDEGLQPDQLLGTVVEFLEGHPPLDVNAMALVRRLVTAGKVVLKSTPATPSLPVSTAPPPRKVAATPKTAPTTAPAKNPAGQEWELWQHMAQHAIPNLAGLLPTAANGATPASTVVNSPNTPTSPVEQPAQAKAEQFPVVLKGNKQRRK